jgi:peptidyl-prolyl cis-trans isomerase SurA
MAARSQGEVRKHMTKKPLKGLGSVVLLLGLAVPVVRAARVVERIIARVNNEIITQRMYNQEKEKLRQQLAQDYSGPELEVQFREQSKNLLRDLIDQALMVQKAKDLDLNVDTDVVKRLDEIRKQYNFNTLEDLEKEVEKSGQNWEDFKDSIKRELLVRQVIEREVGGRILVSQEEARKYYEEHKKEFESPGMVHLAEVLISTQKYKPEEAKKRTDAALAELKAGERFTEVAKKYSDGPEPEQGGDIGFVKEGTMAPSVAAIVSKLDVNENSDPIEIKNGYLILKLLERFSPGIPKFEEVQQHVEEAIYNQKMPPRLREYLTQLRKESYIFLAPGYLDTGAERPLETQLAKSGQ